MQITLPHNLSREEVRNRLRDKAQDILGQVPGGMAEVETSWPAEDRMALSVSVMGQVMKGDIAIADKDVTVTLELPFTLTFVQPMIEGTIREKGKELLA
ncbi:MAG: polyhydroxyalkanoic acid system family protein [Novosphingobium sp.]|nr:polyhydroxyalkanoic acid system family protein [Novosphingobium sp.]